MGWIKLHRQLSEWEWYKTPNMVHLFIHFLLLANHKAGKWQGVEIQPGQFITGRKKLSEQTGISEQSIKTCITRLKSTNEITIKSTNHYSVITICNYSNYQENNSDTNQQNDQQLTNDQPATNQQLTTNNNDKNNKNKKNNTYTPEYEEFWNTYPKPADYEKGNKLEGFKKFKVIFAGGRYSDLMAAVKNYYSHAESKSFKYVLKCPKWFGEWESWINQSKKVDPNIPKHILNRAY